MLDLLLPAYNFALFYANKLVADVPDNQMTGQPVTGRVLNHAAWTLGHLAWANDNALDLIGEPRTLSAWTETMGVGSKPVADRAAYPLKVDLLAALTDAHARMIAALRTVDPAKLAAPGPERMRQMFPTVGHMLAGLITSHESAHLGQLSAWRRAMGFPSAF